MKEKRKQTESYEASHTVRFEKNGITLIALVVTIVVLLILAGISLNLVLGNNGIVTKANLAVVKQENATVAEGLQFKVTNYEMDSIEDIKTALQADRIIDADGQLNTYTLLEQKLKTGNGSNKRDVYVIEDGHLYYYDKNEEKTDLGNLWNLGIAAEETDPSLFEVDEYGNLLLKNRYDYYCSGEFTSKKVWTIENLVIPKEVDGKEVKTVIFTDPWQLSFNKRINGWENLKTVIIPEGVTVIGEQAFMNCVNLTKVVIPDTVTEISYQAFAGCTRLVDIKLPDGVTRMGANSFDGAACYENQSDGDTYIGKYYYGYKGTMPDNANINIKDGTTGICDSAFKNCAGLTNVTIPNSVRNIGSDTFGGCTGLTSVTIPNSVTSIDDYAFYGCTGLTSVTIPNSVTSIGNEAFCVCTGLTSVTIPNNVTSIGNEAFYGCTGLTSVTIPNSVTSIDDHAFSRCTGLTKIVVDENNAVYDSRNNCNAIIEKEANKLIIGCKNTSIPENITSIDDYAFYGCTGLTNITIPDSVMSIGYSTFSECTGLTSVTIPNSVTSIDGFAFSGCTGLTSVIIPNSVTSIDGFAFSGCTGLTNISIPDSVTKIGNYAFSGCLKLTNITIPNSVVNMGWYVFSEWKSEQTINCEAAAKPDGWDDGWNLSCKAKIKWNVK